MTSNARATRETNPYTPAEATLPPITVAGRIERLRSCFDRHGIDALVVTTLPNVRYLTGFSGSAGVLTVTPASAVLTTDGRYRAQSSEQVDKAGAGPDVEIVIGSLADQRAAAQACLGERAAPRSASRRTT